MISSFLAQIRQVEIREKTTVIKMNDGAHVVWASLFSSGQDEYQFIRPDGQVEVNSQVISLISFSGSSLSGTSDQPFL